MNKNELLGKIEEFVKNKRPAGNIQQAVDKVLNIVVREGDINKADKLFNKIVKGDKITEDLSLIEGDTKIVYVKDFLQNVCANIIDVLNGMGMADSTVKSTVKKYKINDLYDDKDNIIAILNGVANSRSKFKKFAIEALKGVI